MSKAPGPYAPPPYRQVGGDGNTYFKVMPPIRGLVDVWVEGIRTVNDLRALASRHPAAGPKAGLLAATLEQMEAKLAVAERDVAAYADTSIQARIRATQVRPDNPQGPAMVQAIQSRPLRPGGSPVPLFSIGVADISILNKGATAPASGKPYWPSQEFGYTGHVGRVVRGFFRPGMVRPDPAQFRVHPIFSGGTGFGARMVIGKPIEERAFLRSGAEAAAIERAVIWKQIEAVALREMVKAASFRGPLPPFGGRRRP